MTRYPVSFACLLLLPGLLPDTVHSAEAAARWADAPTELDRIVVTAVSPVTPLTFETDPRLPRQPVPASDGADYLKTIPGFTAVRNGGTNGDPVLRGMFGSRLNLLTNDGAMPGACPARMDNPLSYVSPETYDRLVIVKGPQTVLWGPGASAGTVRFERDTERFAEPEVRADGSLLFGSAGRNDQVLDLRAGAPAGYARVAANRSEAGDYRDGAGARVPSRWYKWNVDAALGWTPDEDTVVEASAGRGDGEARYAGRGMDGSQFRRESFGLRLEKRRIGEVLDRLEATLFHNRADHVMDNYSLREPNPDSSMPMPMAAQVLRVTRGGRFAAGWTAGRAGIVAGLDRQDSRHRFRNGMGRGSYNRVAWTDDAEFENTGAFAELDLRLDPQRRVVTGARIDRAEAQDRRAVAGMMDLPNPTAGLTRRETLRAAFGRYEHASMRSPWSWYAGLGRTERMPDYWELFSADMGLMGSVNAFAAILPETTTQLDVGAHRSSQRLDVWVSAYAGRVDDFILFRYVAGGMMGTHSQARNVDADIRGGEAGAEWRPAAGWKLSGSLASAWGANRDDGAALPQIPPWEARLALSWEGRNWSAGGLLRGASAQERVSVGEGNVTGQDIGPAAGFVIASVNAGYAFDTRYRLTAGIDNLFDRVYGEHLNRAGSADFGYPADPVRIHEPGRTFWVKLNLSL